MELSSTSASGFLASVDSVSGGRWRPTTNSSPVRFEAKRLDMMEPKTARPTTWPMDWKNCTEEVATPMMP